MTIQFDLPADIEASRRDGSKDVNRSAKEAVLVELYRQSKLSHSQLTKALGISRFKTDALLKHHGVTEDLMTVEEFEQEVESVRRDFRQ